MKENVNKQLSLSQRTIIEEMLNQRKENMKLQMNYIKHNQQLQEKLISTGF